MKCMLCGMEYPPQCWEYYSVRVTAKPEFIMCSDCVDHLMLIIENEKGVITGYGSGVKRKELI
jgi:hypothetical protein